MKRPLAALFFLVLPFAFFAFACGGGDSNPRTDPGKAPTATLPARLPDALIIEGTPAARVEERSGNTYTIVSGDSLSAIAERFGTTVEELMSLNKLETNELEVGQVLKLPATANVGTATPSAGNKGTTTPTPKATNTPESTKAAEPTTEPTVEAQPTREPSAGQTEYTVQDGDNAADIAARFGITVEELAAANGMTVAQIRDLSIGDVLIIPAPSATSTPAVE